MDTRCFMFDLIILNVSIPDFDYEINSLSVDVNFNNTKFTIESNPDKIGDFKEGRTCEFRAHPDDLAKELLNKPLKLSIKDRNDELIGVTEISWPKDLLDKLKKKDFIWYSHTDQCDVIADHMIAGNIGIHYQLRANCELSESEDEHENKPSDVENELKKIVDPNKLFFLLKTISDECSVSKIGSRQMLPIPTAIDLNKFKSLNRKVVTDPCTFDQVYSLDCCHNKKYDTAKCKEASAYKSMDSEQYLQENEKELLKYNDSKTSIQWACRAKKHVQECPHSNKFSDETTESCSSDCVKRGFEQNRCIFENGKIKNICNYPVSPPVLKETVYIRSKLCPTCKSNVSWLPKFAACPKCGHKPIPYAEERRYNEHLTADQILEEWTADNSNQCPNKDIPKLSNRCSCKGGKVCGYCRVQMACKDFLKLQKCPDKNSHLKNISHEELCKSTSESESRIYLAKVFSELRDLYNLKPDIGKNKLGLKSSCKKVFDKSKRLKRQAVAAVTNVAKKPSSKVKAKCCKGKIYNYKTVRTYPGTLIGHKTCATTGKLVPRNMGWLWNANTIGIRRGWKPGAIRKPIKEMMKYFLNVFPVDSLRVSKYSRRQLAKKESVQLVQKPTLHICKKQGVYVITMRPLKDASLLKNCADPYAPMKPIQFRIVKNPLKVQGSQLKKQLKKQFDKCTCHKPIADCCCRTYLDKKRVEFELNKACRCIGIPNLKDTLVLSDTTDSDTEFDFEVTPPAGIIKPHLKNKPDMACRETQYNEEDWALKPVIPINQNKYMKPFDLVDRRNNACGAANSGKQVITRGNGGRGGNGGPEGSDARGGYTGRYGHGKRGGFDESGAYDGRAKGDFIGASRKNIAVSRSIAGKGKTRGAVGGMGGVGGNSGGGHVRNALKSGEATMPKPLFCNLARRRKAENLYCCPPRCQPSIPSC